MVGGPFGAPLAATAQIGDAYSLAAGGLVGDSSGLFNQNLAPTLGGGTGGGGLFKELPALKVFDPSLM